VALALILAVAMACGDSGPGEGGADASALTTVTVEPVDPAVAAEISGEIMFTGMAPRPEMIRTSSDPVCERDGGVVASERLLVGPENQLQNVFVYVKDGLANIAFPVPAEPVILDQKGCRYDPHVFGVQVGQRVEVVNSDPTLHNVHGVARVNQEFNTGQPEQGMRFIRTFSASEVMVAFKCDVHGWMSAYAGVVAHPFFAVTGADGQFSIKGVPPGTYSIEAWHEMLGTRTQSVTVGQREAKRISFTFSSP
jgi:plastocyanin